MARQIRIEYPGAFYHVFSRGNQKQPVFLSDDDRYFFLNCLRKACEKYGVIVHAYCLMLNHFHLIMETPLGNLSNMMHFLITKYTVYFNKKHKRQGHLFQGRYRSVLVEAVGYAKELSRYVHLNPVRAGLVSRPEDYTWSSFLCYLGVNRPEGWLETAVVLKLFSDDPQMARKTYQAFVSHAIGKEPLDRIRNSVKTGVLGSEEFIARIKRTYLTEDIEKPDREKPQLKRLVRRPEMSRIFSASELCLGPRNKLLIPIAIFISHKNASYRLRELAEFFSLSISGVANACKRAQAAMLGNAALVRAVEQIEQEIKE